MKIILVREKGASLSLHITRGLLAGVVMLTFVGVLGLGWYVQRAGSNEVHAQVIAQWRAKLAAQEALVESLSKKNQAQSAAVGRQLAQMQARLLRMEALGAHMSTAAKLQNDEFDFDRKPAQGGPVDGQQATLGWGELSTELAELSTQLRRRETELNILDDVLVDKDIQQASQVKGRPVNWGWMSSPFGQRVDPMTGKVAWHSGVDFAGRDGSDVIAVASGVVTYAGERSGYGQLIEISHRDGLVTRYAHHKSVLVKVGDVVKKGEAIALMGSTGRSTGPHVHFEVLKHGRNVDPAAYVGKRG